MERDIRLDTLRGLVLAWMTLNHLGGPQYAYSFETLGYVSSAEGFVNFSGERYFFLYSYSRYSRRHSTDCCGIFYTPPTFKSWMLPILNDLTF